jgi:1,4-dihydroxy-2-naphthoyl-CoA hydrolase
LEVEQPFGVVIEVRHHKPGVSGNVTGVATFVNEEPCRGGVKQYWDVVAYDDDGDIMTGGTIMTKTMLKSYLEQRNQDR